jgi:hypothetical protein
MKYGLHVVTVGTALAIGAAALPAFAHAQEQRSTTTTTTTRSTDEHPEYRNNQYYRLGNREGYEDYQKKERRTTHDHKYRKDDDRKAHDYGYEQGWSGHRYDENPH